MNNNFTAYFTKTPLIVGSSILNHRYCKDLDVICYKDEITVPAGGDDFIVSFQMQEGKRVECLLADNDESLKVLLEEYRNYWLSEIEICYILKAGHIHISGRNQENWQKHMLDLCILRKLVDTKKLLPFVKEHKKATDKRIKEGTPKLKGVSKDMFFDDNVTKFVEHDSIHELVAYRDKPGYSYMQKDETVECHKDLWDQFSYEEKLQTVAEESMVIALERQIIPAFVNKTKMPLFLNSYKWALYRVCTTLCSGWFRQFALDNYFNVLNMFNEQKLNKVMEEIKNKLKQTA